MATTQIGALSVKITSDTSGLNKGVKSAETNLAKVGKAARKTANEFTKMGLAMGTAAAAAGAAIIASNLKTIDSLAKTADKLGVTTEALQGLQHAGELTGVSVETMNMALQRMTRRVAEAAQGTGEAVKALDELGLSAEELNALSPDEQMLAIAGAMEEVTNQSDRVRLAMKLFDSEGVALVNTLGQGEDALLAMSNEVDALGASITRVDAAKIEQANDAMLRASTASAGFAQQLTVKVAPALTAIVNEMTNVENGTSGVEEAAQQAFDAIVTGAGFVADVFRGWELIIKGIEVAFKGMGLFINEVFAGVAMAIDEAINFAKESINELIEFANNVPGVDIEQLVVGGESGITSFFESSAKVAKESFEEAQAELVKLATTPLPSDAIDEFVAKANEAAQKQAEVIAEATKPIASTGETGEDGEAVGPTAVEQYEAETIGLLEAMGIRFMSQEEMQIAANMRELEILQQQQDQKLISEEEYQKKSSELQRKNGELQRKMMVGQLQGGLKFLQGHSKKVDKAMRAAAIVQATIKGQQAAVDAWQAGMSTGGPWAPAVAAAYTAASLANTASMISSIKSGGSQSSAPSGSTGSVPSGSTTPTSGGSAGATSPSQQVSINLVGGSTFSSDQVRELIGQINEATDDGVELKVSGA